MGGVVPYRIVWYNVAGRAGKAGKAGALQNNVRIYN
jgi:chloramphenicol 3-O-phosphotransferase